MRSSEAIRAAYVARLGKERWTQAINLATSHRHRATRDYGLSDHWTAPEWLDLCEPWDFRCPSCGAEGPLTPYHRQLLCRGGDNTIANILPICSVCHWWIHELGVRCQPSWLPEQFALCERFKAGDLVNVVPRDPGPRHDAGAVNRERPPKFQFTEKPPDYVILEVIPPLKQAFCELINDCHEHPDGISVKVGELTFWRRAMARVGPGEEDLVELQSLAKVDIDPQLVALSQQYVEQQRISREFAVGDGVLFGSAKRPRYGVILGIVYSSLAACDLPLVAVGDIQLARWPTVTYATAILKNLDRRGVPAIRPSWCSLSALTKTDKPPRLDERWRDIWEAMTTSPMSRSMRRRRKAALSKAAA